MKFRPAFAVLSMTLALAACGSEMPWQKKAAEPEVQQGHSGPPTVSPIDQPIETGGESRAVSTADAATMGTKMFRAAGQGWVATAGDSSVVYERPGQKSVGVTTRRMTYARGVEFIGVMSGRPFSLNVQSTECTDASGAKHPFTARLSAAGAKLTGCASATDTMPKAQIKASSATSKPKAAAKPAAPKAAPAKAAEPAVTETPATTAPATTTPATTPATTTPATTSTTPEATTPATTTPATSAPAAPATPAPATTSPAITAPATPAPAVTAPATPAPVVTAPVVIPAPATPAPATPAPATPAPATTAPATGTTN